MFILVLVVLLTLITLPITSVTITLLDELSLISRVNWPEVGLGYALTLPRWLSLMPVQASTPSEKNAWPTQPLASVPSSVYEVEAFGDTATGLKAMYAVLVFH